MMPVNASSRQAAYPVSSMPGGAESDMLMPGHAVNATMVNATLAMANATLVEGGERAASATGRLPRSGRR